MKDTIQIIFGVDNEMRQQYADVICIQDVTIGEISHPTRSPWYHY